MQFEDLDFENENELEQEDNPGKRKRKWRKGRNKAHKKWGAVKGHRRRVKNKGGRCKHRKGRNPGMGAILSRSTLTSGFSVPKITEAGLVIGGAVLNGLVSGFAGRFLPPMLTTGPGAYVTGLVSAGILGAGARMVAPRWAGPIFLGGMVEVVARLVKNLQPSIRILGDYLTQGQYNSARPMGDFLVANQVNDARSMGETIMDEDAAMSGYDDMEY